MTQQQQQQLLQQQQQLPQLQLQQKQLRQPADGTGVHFLAFILRWHYFLLAPPILVCFFPMPVNYDTLQCNGKSSGLSLEKASKYIPKLIYSSTVQLPVENLRNYNNNISMGIVKFSLPIAYDIMYLILKFHHNGLINIYNTPKFATAFITHRY